MGSRLFVLLSWLCLLSLNTNGRVEGLRSSNKVWGNSNGGSFSCRVPRGGAAASLSRPPARLTRTRASTAASLPAGESFGDGASKRKAGASKPLIVGSTTIPNEVMNLVKSILGAGIVGIPAGIAAWGDHPSALIPTTVIIFLIATLAGYGFSMIGTVCGKTQAPSYREAWSRSIGPKSSWIPALAAFLVTCCSVLTASMILADTLPTIVQAVSPGTILPRNAALLINIVSLTPLCLMRELSKLAPYSLIGLLGTLYTAVAMCIRWFTNSYAPGTILAGSLAANLVPQFGTAGWQAAFTNTRIAILTSMLSTAFMAHYNASKFYWELKNNTLPRFYTMVGWSFGISAFFMALVACAGFGTFGSHSQSMILLNYSAKDTLVNAARAAMFISLFFGFPLAFVGVREQLLDLLNVRDPKQRGDLSTPLSLSILTAVTSVAWNLKDIRAILALGGATWGNCVIYIFPSLMLLKAAKTNPDLQVQKPLAKGTMAIGACLGVVGTIRAVSTFLLGKV